MRVNFQQNYWDAKVKEMIEAGYYIKTIAARTGLTEGQVLYRVHRLGISVKDYRLGKSKYAKDMIRRIDDMLKSIGYIKKTVRELRR